MVWAPQGLHFLVVLIYTLILNKMKENLHHLTNSKMIEGKEKTRTKGIFNGVVLETFFLSSGTIAKGPLVQLQSNIVLEVLASAIRQKKSLRIEKETR